MKPISVHPQQLGSRHSDCFGRMIYYYLWLLLMLLLLPSSSLLPLDAGTLLTQHSSFAVYNNLINAYVLFALENYNNNDKWKHNKKRNLWFRMTDVRCECLRRRNYQSRLQRLFRRPLSISSASSSTSSSKFSIFARFTFFANLCANSIRHFWIILYFSMHADCWARKI